MLATLGGALALAVGVAVLLLPVLVSELSRPRDAAWGAVILLLGLVLVTSAERLTGSPMLAVLCAGLLIGRLGSEVGRARWLQLTPEEQQRLASAERWRNALEQLTASLAGVAARAGGMAGSVGGSLGAIGGALTAARKPKAGGKRWVRPETPVAAPSAPEATESPTPETETAQPLAGRSDDHPVAVVRDFTEIEERLAAAQDPGPPVEPPTGPPAKPPAEPAAEPPAAEPPVEAPADRIAEAEAEAEAG